MSKRPIGLDRSMWRPPPRRPIGGGRLPSFVIAGLPKCGTTALAAYLQVHPDVFVVPEKEIHFFDRKFDQGLDWYRSCFTGTKTERAVGEATPTYVVEDETVTRMATTLPDARIILVLRDPIARARSHYWWIRGAATYERRSFEEAVRDEMRRESETTQQYYGYLEGGCYLTYLKRLEMFYSSSATLVVLAEDLKRDAGSEFARVCRFLEVDDSVRPSNLGAPINTSFRRRSDRLHYVMMRSRAYQWLPMAYKIEQWNREPVTYEPLDEDLLRDLSSWFRPHNEALSQHLGRDLTQIWS
ncbi:MAG TPA: sulfotransferase [Actinomycetota bacterium]|nr:sulfotransferase [Actinomycetota bacterium]